MKKTDKREALISHKDLERNVKEEIEKDFKNKKK